MHLPMKMEQTECSETLAYKNQTPENYPEESIQHTEHGESLKSRRYIHFREIYFSRNWRGRHSKCILPLHFSFQINQMFRAMIEARSATVQNNITSQIQLNNYFKADPSGRAGYNVGLRAFACWDCGFESRRRHWCLSLVSVVCCQVEVSASGWSLDHRSPTDCGASLCVI
jgi:hypothetical protein